MKTISELTGGKRLTELTCEELEPVLKQLREQLDSWQPTQEAELIPSTLEELYALPPEALKDRIDLIQDRMNLEEKMQELDQRGVRLGLLKLANQARRCSRLKANGEPCRAPAMGDRLFCVFHSRALEADEQPRMKIEVLEDRESLQLTLKQIMERVVAGSIPPQNAALLLRAVRIADSALKSRHFDRQRRKGIDRQGYPDAAWGNAEEHSA
jgi:hypothetical protein